MEIASVRPKLVAPRGVYCYCVCIPFEKPQYEFRCKLIFQFLDLIRRMDMEMEREKLKRDEKREVLRIIDANKYVLTIKKPQKEAEKELLGELKESFFLAASGIVCEDLSDKTIPDRMGQMKKLFCPSAAQLVAWYMNVVPVAGSVLV